MTGYDDQFWIDSTREAMDAAPIMLPPVLEATKAKTVIDVGCGHGVWAKTAVELGCEGWGVDGYVPPERLRLAADRFKQVDLEQGFDCSALDLAICLEVAEHLHEAAAPLLVEGLCKAKFVFWSAAIPGQGGICHYNEAWPSWWARLFAHHGYVGSSDIGTRFWDDRRIVSFYRQNAIIWASPENLAEAGFEEGVLDRRHPDKALGL
jgi:SAM-dependent methyltransferase